MEPGKASSIRTMKIFFHITGYKSPRQFSWLFNAIYNSGDIYVVHVDQKASDEVHSQFRRIAGDSDNVIFSPSINISWGGTGLIQAEMQAVKLALEARYDWDYLVNLTAQDYPLRSIEDIRAELRKNWPYNFVGCLPIGLTHWKIKKRRWFRHIDRGGRRLWTPCPLIPKRHVSMKWYGPWWHILTRDFCEWWLSSETAKRYLEAHELIGMPDEMLVQNLMHDSPFKRHLRAECKHAMIWRHPWQPRRSSAHPNVLTMKDLPAITSTEAFFARKFDCEVDEEILAVLAEKIHAPRAQGLLN